MAIPVSIRWASLAFTRAKARAGSGGWTLLSKDLRLALVCTELVGILADQEIANGAHMRAACDAVLQMGDRECNGS